MRGDITWHIGKTTPPFQTVSVANFSFQTLRFGEPPFQTVRVADDSPFQRVSAIPGFASGFQRLVLHIRLIIRYFFYNLRRTKNVHFYANKKHRQIFLQNNPISKLDNCMYKEQTLKTICCTVVYAKQIFFFFHHNVFSEYSCRKVY